MANLREIAYLYRPFVEGFRGVADVPEVRTPIWCRIERDSFNGELRVVVRWDALTTVDSNGNTVTVTAVVGSEHVQGSDFSLYFDNESERYHVQGIRPFESDPRRFAELKVRNARAGIPFT